MKRLTSFFSMKKLVLGALACVALVLMMPGEAKAGSITRDNTINLNDFSYYESQGMTWDKTTLTLTLDGVDIIVNGSSAIQLPSGVTVIVKNNSSITANITAIDCGSISGASLTIVCQSGDLTLNGALSCYNGVIVKGDKNLIINNRLQGTTTLWAPNGTVRMQDSGTRKITAYNGIGIGAKGVFIDSGNVEIKSATKFCSSSVTSVNIDGNLKVSWGSNKNSLSQTEVQYNSSYFDALKEAQYVRIYDPNSGITNPFDDTETPDTSTPSDNKSDDKKNESSPFHKFETSSIKEAKASGTIDATGGWKSFDRGTLNELAKLGKDISVTYEFNGHTYCVVVPKGFDPQKLVNEEGYCGFLYLAKVYGAVMIK